MKLSQALYRRLGWRGIVGLVVLGLIPMIAVVGFFVNSGGNFDLGSRAWTGFNANIDNLKAQFGIKELPKKELSFSVDRPGFEKTKKLYMDLGKTYFDAEVQNIDVPEFGVRGAAFLKYDATIDKTFVFAGIEKLPLPNNQVIRLWVTKDYTEYIPAGVMDYLYEKDVFQGYSVFVRSGDLRKFKDLLISYDPVKKVSQPERVVLTLHF